MSFDALLTMRCDVRRRNRSGTADSWGHDTQEHDFTAHLASEPCRVEALGLRARAAQREGTVVTHRIFFRAGRDITNRDRLFSVTDDQGNTVGTGSFDLDTVNPAPGGTAGHHMEALAVEVR